ncbi:unnamed protein product [Prunus armeniaca]
MDNINRLGLNQKSFIENTRLVYGRKTYSYIHGRDFQQSASPYPYYMEKKTSVALDQEGMT